jgi:hypothetical protein
MRQHGRITAAIRVAESAVFLAVSLRCANAQAPVDQDLFNRTITTPQLVLVVGMLAAVLFALICAFVLVRLRNRLAH